MLLDAWTHPFSEPESRALRNVINEINPVLFIDIHNAYPAIWWEIWTLGKKCAEASRKVSWWPDREQLYKTPDRKWYKSRKLNTIFIEWTNRYASDKIMLTKVFGDIFDIVSKK